MKVTHSDSLPCCLPCWTIHGGGLDICNQFFKLTFYPIFLKALCVVMSKQQDRLDQMNLLSERFLHGSASLNIILDERLREVMYVAALEKCVFVVYDLPTITS